MLITNHVEVTADGHVHSSIHLFLFFNHLTFDNDFCRCTGHDCSSLGIRSPSSYEVTDEPFLTETVHQ